MQFNQINNNKGDVNNAISGRGNVVQAVGADSNRIEVDRPKESFWASLWNKVKVGWKIIFG